MLTRRALLGGALAAPVLTAPVLTACAGTVVQPGDLSRLRVMAPASPGGGWDTTARTLQRVLQSSGLARNVQVFNVEGAGGTIGLGQLARQDDDALLMVMGLVMVGAVETNESTTTLSGVTPIARLIDETEVLVAPADTPYGSIQEFVEAWKRDPRALPVAGGSAGGSDQILAGLVALAGGVDPAGVNYIPYSGGGESLAALLGGKVALGISGVGEYAPQVQSGDLVALAVSSPERSPVLPDAPTLIESGFDVELANWRGLMARPGMSAEARTDLTDLVTRMHGTEEWREALEDNEWQDSFSTGAGFESFLRAEEQRVREVLTEIGLIS